MLRAINPTLNSLESVEVTDQPDAVWVYLTNSPWGVGKEAVIAYPVKYAFT